MEILMLQSVGNAKCGECGILKCVGTAMSAGNAITKKEMWRMEFAPTVSQPITLGEIMSAQFLCAKEHSVHPSTVDILEIRQHGHVNPKEPNGDGTHSEIEFSYPHPDGGGDKARAIYGLRPDGSAIIFAD